MMATRWRCCRLSAEASLIQIAMRPISTGRVTQAVRKHEHGAVVTFTGTVRNTSRGKRVLYLEYETYQKMAEAKLRQVADEIRQRWQLHDVAMVHRVGRLEVGDVAVVIAVGAPHRKEAFAACQYAIDRIKAIVPIWKKEVFEDGEVWVETEESVTRDAAPGIKDV